MLLRRTLVTTTLLSLLVGSITYASSEKNLQQQPVQGNLENRSFAFTNLSEYDDSTLDVMIVESEYSIEVDVNDKLKKVKDQKEKTDHYTADVTIASNSVEIFLDDVILQVEKEKLNLSENKKGNVASILAYNEDKTYKLNLSFGWVNNDFSVLTGSASLTEYVEEKTNTRFLTLGEFTQTINKSKMGASKDKDRTDMVGSLEAQEAVLLTGDYYDDNNLRVSLNRSSKNIIRGENAILFFAAAPKYMNDDDFSPEITHAAFTINSVGDNAVVTKPFGTYSTKPGANDSVSVGFSYAGIGGSYSWSVGSTTPKWYEGTTGIWDFPPDIYYTQALQYGIPVEGYIYGDQVGQAKIEATTDIDWREYYKDSTSIIGMRIVSKNNTDWHGPVTFDVVSP